MVQNRHCRPLALLVAAVLILGGCGATGKVAELFAEPYILPCPDYFILADASELTRYRDDRGRDLTDVDFEGRMGNIRISCITRVDRETKVGEMDVQIAFDIQANRGPANKSRRAEYPYFLTVTDTDKKILYREQFKVGIGFEGNQTKVFFQSDPVTITLPIRPDVTDKNYLIYGGFLLTREQLQSNRLRRQQRNN